MKAFLYTSLNIVIFAGIVSIVIALVAAFFGWIPVDLFVNL